MINFPEKPSLYLDPFPHVVIENFWGSMSSGGMIPRPGGCSDLLRLWPTPDERWYNYDNALEKKWATDRFDLMEWAHKAILGELNAPTTLQFLEKTFGIPGLIPDPYYRGGGLHHIVKGGKLDIHSDFNIHPKLGLERKLNLLLYLNPHWEEGMGGELELWNKEMTECKQRIAPLMNRCVIFRTDDDSNHGHPTPWNSDIPRRSIATYYYTVPQGGIIPHSTTFKKRPEDSDELDELREKRSKGRL